MYRIFLKQKLLSGDESTASDPKKSRKFMGPSNRRITNRYSVSKQHLTVLNEQDILIVKDLSATGFSSQVSPRAFDRFAIDDVFAARLRYLGEIYDLKIKVCWKNASHVGFQIEDPDLELIQFVQRILKPIEIAKSIYEVEAEFLRAQEVNKSWFHGDQDTELFVWRDENGRILSWKLCSGELIVEWEHVNGFQTGRMMKASDYQKQDYLSLSPPEEGEEWDIEPNQLSKQFAMDLLMALELPSIKEELLATLSS